MEKYLINNKTIALLKINNKTMIINVDKVNIFNKSINQIIDYNCNYYGSSKKGRLMSAKKILNSKYKLPIVIDDNNNLILINLESSRKSTCLYIISNKIVNYENYLNKLKIICCKNVIFYTKISKHTLDNLLIKSFKLNNVLNHRKNLNLL